MIKMQMYKSKRGGDIKVHEDYIYNKDKLVGSLIRWRCQLRGCTGFLFTDGDYQFVETKAHNHSADKSKCLRFIAMNNIKEKSRSTNIRAIDIVADEIHKLDENTIAVMPHMNNIMDRITKIRNKAVNFIPGEYQDIPNILKQTLGGESFFRYDSGFQDPERFLIFVSDFSLKILKKVKTFVVDGTFKACPNGFYQVVTIHAFIFGRTYPLFYTLLKTKTESNYQKVFSWILANFKMQPKYFICDFEKAEINALKYTFPYAKINGCIFHFGQNIWRKLQKSGLNSLYNTNPLFKKIVRMLLNLTFVREDKIEKYFNIILKIIEENKV